MAEDRNVTTGYIVHRDKIDQFDSRIRYVKKAVYLISDVLLNFIGGKGEEGGELRNDVISRRCSSRCIRDNNDPR